MNKKNINLKKSEPAPTPPASNAPETARDSAEEPTPVWLRKTPNFVIVRVPESIMKNRERDYALVDEAMMRIFSTTPPESAFREKAQESAYNEMKEHSRERDGYEAEIAQLEEDVQVSKAALKVEMNTVIKEACAEALPSLIMNIPKGGADIPVTRIRRNGRGMKSSERRRHKLETLRVIVPKVVAEYPDYVKDEKGRVTGSGVFEAMKRFNRTPPGFTLPDSPGRWIGDINKILADIITELSPNHDPG